MKKVFAWVAALIAREPAIVGTVLGAVLGVLASFGFDLTADQTKAIMALLAVLAGVGVRSQVTPTG